MKHLEFKWRKRTWLYIAVLILVCALTFMVSGALDNLLEYWTAEPLYEDTNVKSIRINERFQQGDITFRLKRLEVGDTYSVLLFDSEPGGALLHDAKLYQDGEQLLYVSKGTATSKYVDTAIAYQSPEGTDSIELHIKDGEGEVIVIPIS